MRATNFRWIKSITRTGMALLVLALAGCAGLGGGAAAPKSPGTVLARVNGEAIRQSDVDTRVAMVIDEAREAKPDLTDREIVRVQPRMRRDALEELIDGKLVEQAIKREGIQVTDAQVEARLRAMDEELRREGLSVEGLRESMKTTPEKLRAGVRARLTEEAFWDRRLGLKPPTEAELRQAYEGNKQRFTTPPAVHLHEIFVPFAGDRRPTRAERRDLRLKAEALRARLTAGEPFADVARDAAGPSARGAARGDLGWVTEFDPLPMNVLKTAFGLQVGRVSEVIESADGFHVLVVSEKRGPQVVPFEQVRGRMMAAMQQMARQKRIPEELKKMRREAKIEKP